jgi:hypothetical protein
LVLIGRKTSQPRFKIELSGELDQQTREEISICLVKFLAYSGIFLQVFGHHKLADRPE